MGSRFVIGYLVVNFFTFLLFAVDKWKAKRGAWRIPEATLLGFSLFGGALGGVLGMHLCHHKIRKPRFRYGVPVMLLLQLLVCGFLFFNKF